MSRRRRARAGPRHRRGRLLHGLAEPWCEITGNAEEDMAILPETADDPGAVS